MNAAILLIPLFIIRYGLLFFLNRGAISMAAHFPPMQGIGKTMRLIYQVSTLAIIIYSFFLDISAIVYWRYVGLIVYFLGVELLILAVVDFTKPNGNGFCRTGLYRISRNPMYVSYFIYFLGCVLLTQSLILFGILCVFQISSHWIILSEERWCIDQFGAEYTVYMKMVRRYI